MTEQRFARPLMVSACVLLLVPAAWAQSGISGVVRDESGAVLPGVQLDARSLALIEQVRTVYTDGQVVGFRIEPQFNVFNLTNANDVLQITTRFGPAWQDVRNVLPARMIKLGVQVDF